MLELVVIPISFFLSGNFDLSASIIIKDDYRNHLWTDDGFT